MFLFFIRKLFTTIGRIISRWIDYFYPPFGRFFSLTFFRYGVCGASNMAFDWVLYFLTYNFLIQKKMMHISSCITLSPHVASLFMTFPITLFTGFLLQKYVTFSTSNLRGKKQLIRYLLVVILNLLINYAGLKLLVDWWDIFPTPSKMIITIVTTIISYISQKKFTFKISNEA